MNTEISVGHVPTAAVPPRLLASSSHRGSRDQITWGDERLGHYTPGLGAEVTADLPAGYEEELRKNEDHESDLLAARASARISDAALLTQRDYGLLADLQVRAAPRFASVIMKLLGPATRYQKLRAHAAYVASLGPTQPALALASALAAASARYSRDCRLVAGGRVVIPNLLIVSAAPSGRGKNAAMRGLKCAVAAMAAGPHVVEKLASAQALEDVLAERGAICLALDEFGTPSSATASGKLFGTVVDFYSRSGELAPVMRKAGKTPQAGAQGEVLMTGLLMGTPRNVLAQLTPRIMAAGLASRTLLLPDTEMDDEACQQALQLSMETCLELQFARPSGSFPNLPASAPPPAVNGKTGEQPWAEEGAAQVPLPLTLADWGSIQDVMQRVQDFQNLSQRPTCNPNYARFREMVLKVACLLHLCRVGMVDPGFGVVDRGDLEDALALVLASAGMLDAAGSIGGNDEIVQTAFTLLDWLEKKPGQRCRMSDIRSIRRDARYRNEAWQWLQDEGYIRITPSQSGGGESVERTSRIRC